MKAYPALIKYTEAKGYKLEVIYELYGMKEKTIYFIAPIEE